MSDADRELLAMLGISLTKLQNILENYDAEALKYTDFLRIQNLIIRDLTNHIVDSGFIDQEDKSEALQIAYNVFKACFRAELYRKDESSDTTKKFLGNQFVSISED
ncbi:MAG TPA: hypothetical protein VJU85_06090 [Nitrososphaeraceae archaeon]|nr:hypothetical protein [Nitrososphaeraceae archaeon]